MHAPPVRAVLVTALGALASCGYPRPGPAPQRLTQAEVLEARLDRPELTAARLESGRRVFLQHCNRCHDYANLSAYSPDEWSKIIPRMGRAAELTGWDTGLVLEFVLVARPEPRFGEPKLDTSRYGYGPPAPQPVRTGP